jgi:hypothetical protein
MLSEDELNGVPLLVFCNKQDVAGAVKPDAISEELGLAGGEKNREWSVRGACATKGEGLEEGLDWSVVCSIHLCPTDEHSQARQRHSEEVDTIYSLSTGPDSETASLLQLYHYYSVLIIALLSVHQVQSSTTKTNTESSDPRSQLSLGISILKVLTSCIETRRIHDKSFKIIGGTYGSVMANRII